MKTNYNNSDEQIIQMLTPKVEVKPSADLRSRILAAAEQQNLPLRVSEVLPMPSAIYEALQ